MAPGEGVVTWSAVTQPVAAMATSALRIGREYYGISKSTTVGARKVRTACLVTPFVETL
jgi:hypothetical protein